MLVSLISLIFVFVEATLASEYTSYIFVMTYFMYLINQAKKRTIINIFFIIVIYSLQNRELAKISLTFGLLCGIYYLVFLQMKYNRDNILAFSGIQILILMLFFKEKIEFHGYIFNFVGMILMNYFYSVKTRGKSGT